jgi:predicted DNA-binding transcriptional regulator YafY
MPKVIRTKSTGKSPAHRTKRRTKKKPPVRIAPATRLEDFKRLLRAGWATPADVVERLGVSRATAFRLVSALEKNEPVERESIEGKLRWRLPTGHRDVPLRISTSEMVALAFVKNALGFLAGTGIKEDLDALFERLSHALKQSDYAHWKNLDRKLFDVNEAHYDYSDKIDVVNDVITALLREERVTLTQKDGERVKVDPYTLTLYKKGLYLACWSHRRGDRRNFGLDKIEDVERHVGEHFEYPDAGDWDPAAYFRPAWGIIRGELARVVLRFDANVTPFVTRRVWHYTQSFAPQSDGTVEMRVQPEGATEMFSWIYGYGSTVEVLEPQWMREKVAAELRKAADRYASPGCNPGE